MAFTPYVPKSTSASPGFTPYAPPAAPAPTKPQTFLQKAAGFAENALPTVGALGGSIGGAALGGLAGIETGPGAVATGYAGGVAGAGVGAAAGEALKEKLQGGKLSGSTIAKTGAGFGALEAVGGPIIKAAGSVVEAAGKGIAEAVIPKSMQEAGISQAYKAGTSLLQRAQAVLGMGGKSAPTTAASTAFSKGLIGTESMMGVQAKRAQSAIWDKIVSPALKASKVSVDIPSFFKDAEAKILSETNDPTRQKALLTALSSIKEDFGEIGKISLEQLQKYQEGWAEFVPEKAYKGESIAGALNDVRNTLAGMSRSKIYDALGGPVKQAYLDYGNLNGIAELGKKAMAGGVIKPGGTFTGLKNIFETLTVPIGTVGGQTIYKVGQGLELLGAPGARTVRDIILGSTQGLGSTSTTAPNQ